MVDSAYAYQDHYSWAHQHPFTSKTRRTLKASPVRSFQPQRRDGTLINLISSLDDLGYSLEEIRTSLRKGFASKPMVLTDAEAMSLYAYIDREADIRLTGGVLSKIRATHPELGS